jgi:hypothetical protein
VPDVLLRAIAIEPGSAFEPRHEGHGTAGFRRRRRSRHWKRRGCRRRGDQLLQRARCRTAAGNAAREAALAAARDRLGVALAEIAALPAVELRHRRHEPTLERSSGGEGEAGFELERRIMPGKTLRLADGGFGGLWREVRRPALIAGIEEAGEKAV